MKILMVDDEPDAKLLFQQNFRREIRKDVYEFLYAHSGDEALQTLEAVDLPDVLVMLSDINMPGMSGVELLEIVKGRWPELPVMMITAYGDPGTEESVKQKGAKDLVPKPVDFAHLRAELQHMSESSQA